MGKIFNTLAVKRLIRAQRSFIAGHKTLELKVIGDAAWKDATLWILYQS